MNKHFDDTAVHLAHCFQPGDGYDDSCKYGEDDCPAREVAEARRLKEAELLAYAFQGSTTDHVLHSYTGPKGKLELVQCTRHYGGGAEVEYEIRVNGSMCDYATSIAQAVYLFNNRLKDPK